MKALVAVSFGWLAVATSVAAEVPPWDQGRLNQEPFVVSGPIAELNQRSLAIDDCERFIDIAVLISLPPGQHHQTAYSAIVRAHRYGWACPDRPSFPGASGTWGLDQLKVGDRIKVYAQPVSDGTYVIVAPNGVELLK